MGASCSASRDVLLVAKLRLYLSVYVAATRHVQPRLVDTHPNCDNETIILCVCCPIVYIDRIRHAKSNRAVPLGRSR